MLNKLFFKFLGHLVAETRVKVRSFLNRKEEVAGASRSTVNRIRKEKYTEIIHNTDKQNKKKMNRKNNKTVSIY